MPKFAANLSTMFTEWDFLDRFGAAADNGFKAVEYLFPYEYPASKIAKALNHAKIEQALFNFPAGRWANGDRGLAVIEDRNSEFRDSIAMGLEYAQATGVKGMHLAGIGAGQKAAAIYAERIEYAREALEHHQIDLLIEPINERDIPGYFMNSFDLAEELIRGSQKTNLKLQFDIYHRQILAGDVVHGIESCLSIIGHVQIASVPTRNEPCSGELDDAFVLQRLDQLGYSGFVGCEYRPAHNTVDGLSWRHTIPWH